MLDKTEDQITIEADIYAVKAVIEERAERFRATSWPFNIGPTTGDPRFVTSLIWEVWHTEKRKPYPQAQIRAEETGRKVRVTFLLKRFPDPALFWWAVDELKRHLRHLSPRPWDDLPGDVGEKKREIVRLLHTTDLDYAEIAARVKLSGHTARNYANVLRRDLGPETVPKRPPGRPKKR